MAKTITISDVGLHSIVINAQMNGKVQTGYSCNVNYYTKDPSGNVATQGSTKKYTQDSEFDVKLSDDSNTLVVNFINAMLANMNAKEEL
jgi:hypothetical protein